MEDFRRVNCLAIDSSISSKNAFEWYVNNFHGDGDSLVIMHVREVLKKPLIGPMGVMGGQDLFDIYQETVEYSLRCANDLLKYYTSICEEKKIECESAIVDDYHGTGYEICELVEKYMGTSVILGRKSPGIIHRFILGSTSDYVLHHSRVPVIVVPADKKHP
ncbi:uncharacterized protein LOC100202767 [Hydra vulgaris]|uniref:uncharacterized protein LOC100202767 n=1 Tax=Hydra vulgaris TaxID=6087 RepID=UPI000192751A